MSRRLAITKRVDLSDVAEGWNGCYALVTPCANTEYQALMQLHEKKATNLEWIAAAAELGKSHFISGEIRIINDAGQPESAPMETSDLDTPDILNLVIPVITGVIPDPKASSTATETSLTTEPSNEQ